MLAEAHASLGLVRLATPRLVLLETAAFWSCEALVHTRRVLDDILERHTEYEWRYVEIDSVALGASVDRSRLWLLGARKARVQENGGRTRRVQQRAVSTVATGAKTATGTQGSS